MAERDVVTGRFLPGHAGGPGRGNKAITSRTFIQDMEDAWTNHGAKLIETVISEDPATALRVFASLVPRELLVRNMNRGAKIIDPAAARADVERMLAQRRAPGLPAPPVVEVVSEQ